MTKEDLRIVFMGTPEFAVGTLQALVDNNYNVVGVVTQPDRPVGRHGSVLQPPAVKQYALEHQIPVLQPEKMKDPVFIETLRAWNANLQVVVAFRMLPEVVWAMPEYGTFNVHASLLPQYRGAAPINWAIINGETQTGVTTFFLDHDIDTGRIILQRSFPIPEDADVEYVYDGLMNLGAQLCLDTIEVVITADGHPDTVPQEDARYIIKAAPKIYKETCEIIWTKKAKHVYDFIRGLSPIPGAWTTLVSPEGKETMLKIYKAQQTHRQANAVGTIETDKSSLYISAADYQLEILELQLSGKRRMKTSDFLNGIKMSALYTVR